MKKLLFSGLILMIFSGSLSRATVRHVPSEYPSIQQGISACVDGDTLIVAPGIYYETINFSGKDIVVRSTDPNDPKVVGYTIINADEDGTAVTFENGETNAAVLTGFTITGGVGTLVYDWDIQKEFYGGGIYCSYNASPTITRNVITNNHCPYFIVEGEGMWRYAYSYGGGIGCRGGAPDHHAQCHPQQLRVPGRGNLRQPGDDLQQYHLQQLRRARGRRLYVFGGFDE